MWTPKDKKPKRHTDDDFKDFSRTGNEKVNIKLDSYITFPWKGNVRVRQEPRLRWYTPKQNQTYPSNLDEVNSDTGRNQLQGIRKRIQKELVSPFI